MKTVNKKMNKYHVMNEVDDFQIEKDRKRKMTKLGKDVKQIPSSHTKKTNLQHEDLIVNKKKDHKHRASNGQHKEPESAVNKKSMFKSTKREQGETELVGPMNPVMPLHEREKAFYPDLNNNFMMPST